MDHAVPWKPKPTEGPTPAELFRDSVHTRITCGIDGCHVLRAGPFGEARTKMAKHRAERHPDWTPPVYRIRGRRRIRVG